MFGRISKTSVAIALVATLSLHWAFLQTVAWMGMVVSYSEHAPLREALASTFDGKHPCCLCRAIAAGKKSEGKNEFTAQNLNFEFPPAKGNPIFIPPASFQLLPQLNSFSESLLPKPPSPPPRGCFA
jgi:hypothetical protein